jgi:hypothetical protein
MTHPGFIVEFNHPSAYGRRFDRELSGLGLSARRLPHKTAWLLNYNGDFETFSEFREAVAASLRARGSALAVSMRTRRAWVMRKTRSHRVALTSIFR